jgi:ATP-dependent DNA helicase RecQ
VSFPTLDYIEDIYHKAHIFFDIPYDTCAGRQLKFDLDEFCRRFGLQRASAYYSIVYLERTGHWTLSEDVDISTKVQVRVDRSELYDIDLPDPKMSLLLETLMRKYTGLFTYPVPIDEDYIASCIGVQVPMLRQLLYKLSLEHIIKYIPSDHATVLYLHHDRLRPKNVHLDPERYAFLKEAGTARMQKMIDYVSQEDTCRSSYLLEYFGQTDSADCGTCDVCRRTGKNIHSESNETTLDHPGLISGSEGLKSELTKYINEEQSGVYTLDDIKVRFLSANLCSSDSLLTLLRNLIDCGVVPSPLV